MWDVSQGRAGVSVADSSLCDITSRATLSTARQAALPLGHNFQALGPYRPLRGDPVRIHLDSNCFGKLAELGRICKGLLS